MDKEDVSAMRRGAKKKSVAVGKWKIVIDYGGLLVGCLILAFSFNVFLNPNQIASGGVSGISTIIQHILGIAPAWTQWALNIPLFFLGLLLIGRQYGVKVAVGSILLPLCILLLSHMPVLTENTLLASIYGGMGVGLGLGIVFKTRGSTGGLSIAAELLHRYTGISLGAAIAVFDGLVIVGAGFAFSAEKALYALITLFVTGKMIDLVQMGFSFSKVAFVISDRVEDLRKAILFDLDRGLTELQGVGGFSGERRNVLMVVVSQTEVGRFKALVKSVDPSAFIIISDTHEVLGEGFKRNG